MPWNIYIYIQHEITRTGNKGAYKGEYIHHIQIHTNKQYKEYLKREPHFVIVVCDAEIATKMGGAFFFFSKAIYFVLLYILKILCFTLNREVTFS